MPGLIEFHDALNHCNEISGESPERVISQDNIQQDNGTTAYVIEPLLTKETGRERFNQLDQNVSGNLKIFVQRNACLESCLMESSKNLA